jgi:hypothetical protein
MNPNFHLGEYDGIEPSSPLDALPVKLIFAHQAAKDSKHKMTPFYLDCRQYLLLVLESLKIKLPLFREA